MSPLGDPQQAHLTSWDRAEQQNPESQGKVFMLSVDLPPCSPLDHKLCEVKPSEASKGSNPLVQGVGLGSGEGKEKEEKC